MTSYRSLSSALRRRGSTIGEMATPAVDDGVAPSANDYHFITPWRVPGTP